ncbi:membrane protein [Caballeronia novacaledonica]|uniref:Membrane protein n=1 Tax=Caballeronia novacaledonica TaxID=1544861 RepID=A0A2U3I1G7_9BURK|nr:TadG family pilus assembly protein [Caballeronia novacaledonica]SPB13949.1 membrane protein [Caballeronia novacaledonica]
MTTHRYIASVRRRERGAAGTLAAIWLVVAIAALGAIDIGNLFFARRSLQSVVDLAASAGAQVVDAACARAQASANGSATSNGFDPSAAGNGLNVACGRWDAQTNAAPDYFSTNGAPANAVKVTASRTVPYFFLGPARQVTATAIAKATGVGAFSIGTTLASIGAGTVNSLLNALLGTNLNLSLVSYQGLADARVRVGDLVAAAGAGTVDQLLATQLTAAQIAKLMLTALQTTSVVNANLSTALGAMGAIVDANIPGNQTIPLGSIDGAPGLLSVGLANTQSALDATINPLEALFVAAEIAQAGKAAATVGAGLALPGLISAALKVQIVQPPVLAVGEAGKDASGHWRTLARTAQVRAFVDVSVLQLPLPAGLGGSQPTVHLPLYIDVAPGAAWLVSTQCQGAASARRSMIGVQTGIANVCVGDTPANMGAFSCTRPATLVNVPNLLTVSLAASLPATMPASAATTLSFNGVSGDGDDYQPVPSAPGASLANALSGLGASLSAPGGLSVRSPILPPLLLDTVAPLLLGLLVPALASVLAGLDQALMPVLQLLGAQVGTSMIHDLSLTCGESQLAY